LSDQEALMDELRDPWSIGWHAVMWTWVWLAGQLLAGVAGLSTALLVPAGTDPDTVDTSTLAGRLVIGLDIALLIDAILLVIAISVSGIWIHRMTRVKRVLAHAPSMTPGWAVGWFFIPIANLFKPFDGIREAWQVASGATDWSEQPTPTLLRSWWALWLIWGIVQNIDSRIEQTIWTGWMLALSAAFAVPLATLWVRIIRHISHGLASQGSAAAFR
jgi:hypothetical protein